MQRSTFRHVMLTWQASATYVTSFVHGLEKLGHLRAVSARLDPLTLAMVKAPGAEAWWPGDRLIALLEATEAEVGVDAVKQAGLRGSHDRMGPLVRPLASVLLSLSKNPMQALLSRLSNFVGAGIRGIDTRFVPHVGKPGGVVTFTFPQPVPPVMAAVWHGMFDVGFSLAKAGRIASEQVEPTVHRYEVTW